MEKWREQTNPMTLHTRKIKDDDPNWNEVQPTSDQNRRCNIFLSLLQQKMSDRIRACSCQLGRVSSVSFMK